MDPSSSPTASRSEGSDAEATTERSVGDSQWRSF